MTVDLPRQFKSGRIGISDVPTEPELDAEGRVKPNGRPWTTRWTGTNRDIPMPLGTGGGYVYRRDQRGWIEPGPASPSDQQRFLNLGQTFLLQYGEHEGGPDTINHEYEMLLRLGGGREMPVEQVINLGFAVRSPLIDGQPLWQYSPLEAFPQLAGVEIPPLRRCRFCSREMWLDAQEQSHVSVMHADRIAAFEQANAIASGMSEALNIGRASATGAAQAEAVTVGSNATVTWGASVDDAIFVHAGTPVIEDITPPDPEPEPTEPEPQGDVRCNYCGRDFPMKPSTFRHIKECKAEHEPGS